jgi:spermidine synthase
MGKLEDFLSGTKVLEEAQSPVNGRVTVIRSMAWGTYIQVDNLTQSGGILKNVWKRSLKRIKNQELKIKNCLVVGLGGGTVVGLVKKYWPDAGVAGIDIDPIMVELGRKYLKMENVDVVIGDGFEYIKKEAKKGESYDLILTDTYIGNDYPKRFESDNYIKYVKRSLSKEGKAVFNRLYFDGKRKQAIKFGEKLEKYFSKVEIVYPEANIMFICSH